MHRFLTITNYLLIVAILAIAAALTSDTLSRRLTPAPRPETASAKTANGNISRQNDLSYYAPILSNALFGQATKATLTPIINAPAGMAAVPVTAPSELLLLGTATGSHRETFALVRHTTKQEERVFRLGDMVFDAGSLVQVTREQAFIAINGKKVELLTPMTPPAAKSSAQTQSPHNSTVAVANQGGNSYVIDQRALNAALDNPAQAMTDARLLPSQKDGKVEGFRASEVKPQGVFGMIGIKNGDVIKSLNDFPMDSPDKALQSFIALKGQSRLKMDIIRDGQPQTLTYDIR